MGAVSPPRAVSTRWVTVFVPGVLDLKMDGSIFDPGMGNYRPQVRQDLDVVPWDNSCRALAPWDPADQQSADGGGVFIPCGAVSTRGVNVFIPGSLKL